MKNSKPTATEAQRRIRFHLPYLHCFWNVARLRSFTKAAKELNISQSAVSYQIAKLESTIGHELILRAKGSAFQLSREGKALADQCSKIFLQLEQTLGTFWDSSVSGELKIAAPTCFGALLLTHVTAKLAVSAPGLDIGLTLADLHIDLRDNQIDVAIRTMTTGQDVSTIPLLKTSMALVGAPEFISRGGPIRELGDLAGQKMILSGPENADWQNLLQQRPAVSEVPLDFVYIDNVWGILHAAQSGLGVAYLPRYAVMDGLESGMLTELMPETTRDVLLTLCLSTQSDVSHDRRLQVFLSELSSVLDSSPYKPLFNRVGPLWEKAI